MEKLMPSSTLEGCGWNDFFLEKNNRDTMVPARNNTQINKKTSVCYITGSYI